MYLTFFVDRKYISTNLEYFSIVMNCAGSKRARNFFDKVFLERYINQILPDRISGCSKSLSQISFTIKELVFSIYF